MNLLTLETVGSYTVRYDEAPRRFLLGSVTAHSAYSPLRLTIEYPSENNPLGVAGQDPSEPRYYLEWETTCPPDHVGRILEQFGSGLVAHDPEKPEEAGTPAGATYAIVRQSDTGENNFTPQRHPTLPDTPLPNDLILMYAYSEETGEAASWRQSSDPRALEGIGTLALCSNRPFSDLDIFRLVTDTTEPGGDAKTTYDGLGVLDGITKTYMWAMPAKPLIKQQQFFTTPTAEVDVVDPANPAYRSTAPDAS